MFSSPIMQRAERIFTVSVIMCGCFGSIALDNSKRLLSSPRILCKPYWEKQKTHGEKAGLALDTHHCLWDKILRDSPSPSLPQGGWQHSTKIPPKAPGHYCWGTQVSVPSLVFEVFSWQRQIQLLRRTPGPCKISTHQKTNQVLFSIYVWNTSEVWKICFSPSSLDKHFCEIFSKRGRSSCK